MRAFIGSAEFALSVTVITTLSWCVCCCCAAWTIKKRRALRDCFVAWYLLEAADTDELIGIYNILDGGVSSLNKDAFERKDMSKVVVTRADVRNELIRDPVATEMLLSDDTPEDVQRYLYLEAMSRAHMRKHNLLGEGDNNFFDDPRKDNARKDNPRKDDPRSSQND